MANHIPYTYLTPRDTAKILEVNAAKCQHMGLTLARYMPREVIDNDDVPNEKFKKYRDTWLKDITRNFEPDLALVAANVRRWRAMTTRAVFKFKARLTGRLVIGLGGASPIETDILLDHVTGLPFVPGSALKGLARNYGLLEIAAALDVPIETEALVALEEQILEGRWDTHPQAGKLAAAFRVAFGTQEDAGACVFYDAVLVSFVQDNPLYVVDVMTPHFRRYYESSGGAAPSDDDSPNPIAFMTVAEGCDFFFAVGTRMGFDDRYTVETASLWLIYGLQWLGVGAKTASGYGVFKMLED